MHEAPAAPTPSVNQQASTQSSYHQERPSTRLRHILDLEIVKPGILITIGAASGPPPAKNACAKIRSVVQKGISKSPEHVRRV
ncbi:MAG: hypothetical protein NZ602_01295 [Thermoguttaceae bacterium]|nr:hypothetical protein [Thermoguttaceae bacterium]